MYAYVETSRKAALAAERRKAEKKAKIFISYICLYIFTRNTTEQYDTASTAEHNTEQRAHW